MFHHLLPLLRQNVADGLVLNYFMEAFAADTSCHARKRPYHGRAEECITRDAPSSPATRAASFIAVRGVRGAREAMHEALPDDGV